MVSKYQTFDGEIIDDGWYVAQYKEDREVCWVYKGHLYVGPWCDDENKFIMEKDTSKKHHNFRPIYT